MRITVLFLFKIKQNCNVWNLKIIILLIEIKK